MQIIITIIIIIIIIIIACLWIIKSRRDGEKLLSYLKSVASNYPKSHNSFLELKTLLYRGIFNQFEGYQWES